MLWIVALMHWMIGGEIELPSGILGIFAGLGLGVVCLNPPIPALQPIAYILVWATLALFLPIRAALQQRELKSVDVHALEKAYFVLGQRPGEAFGRFRLAQAAWKLGMTGHAIRIAEGCLQEMDPKVFREEHMMVRRWTRDQPGAEMFVDYTCMDCGGACPAGRTHCPKCGAPFLLDRQQARAFGKGAGRKIVAAWVAAAVALAGIPYATTLPPGPAIGAILAILGLAFLVVFLAFKPKGQTA